MVVTYRRSCPEEMSFSLTLVSTLKFAASSLQTTEPWLSLDFCISGWIMSAICLSWNAGLLRYCLLSLGFIFRRFRERVLVSSPWVCGPLLVHSITDPRSGVYTLSRKFGAKNTRGRSAAGLSQKNEFSTAPLWKPEISHCYFTWNWPPYQLPSTLYTMHDRMTESVSSKMLHCPFYDLFSEDSPRTQVK